MPNSAVFSAAYTNTWDTEDFGGAPDEYKYFSAADGAAALQTYINTIKGTAGNYAVIVEGTQHILSVAFISDINVKISLRGSGTVTLDNGRMFYVRAGNKLILRGPKLAGKSNNDNSIVGVNGALGEFVMHTGEISGNDTSSSGGGVGISYGNFTMNGGTISGNNATSVGGGVAILLGGTFTMNGGTISGNTTGNKGGGVHIDSTASPTFNMNGGTIKGFNAGHSDTLHDPTNPSRDDCNVVWDAANNSAVSGSGAAVYNSGGTVNGFTLLAGTGRDTDIP
jgi:hypothetical protein